VRPAGRVRERTHIASAVAGTTIAALGILPGAASAAIDAQPSASGAHVYFTTEQSMLGLDTDSQVDLYQRSGGSLALSSQGPNGFNGPFGVDQNLFFGFDSGAAVFVTPEPLSSIDTDAAIDVYRRLDGETTLASQGGSFNNPNDAHLFGATDDGKHVFFTTRDRLSGRDVDDALDLYRREQPDTTVWLSRGPAGVHAPIDATPQSFETGEAITATFTTAEQLLSSDTDNSVDLYERLQRITRLVSRGPNGFNGAFDALGPVTQSRDASKLFFRTAEPLVAADTDASVDLYERSNANTTTLVSQGPNGFNGAFDVSSARPSEDGSRVLFTTAEQLVAADTDASVDVYERSGTTTTLVSQGSNGFNGAFDAELRTIANDGERAVFTTAEQLDASDTDAEVDVYSRAGYEPTLVSQGPNGLNGPFPATFEGVSADGVRVFFTTAEPLVAADTDSSIDVYDNNVFTGTTLHSAGAVNGNGAFDAAFAGFAPGNVPVREPAVLFTTDEQLIPTDTDASADVYARSGSTTRLISTPKPDPPAPTLSVSPDSPANDNAPVLRGAAEDLSTVSVFTHPDCLGSSLAVVPAADFASAGIEVAVGDDSTIEFAARATDANNNAGPCTAPQTYVEDSTRPDTWKRQRHRRTRDRTPKIRFGSTEPESSFTCRVDRSERFDCASPLIVNRLSLGRHKVRIKAIDAAGNRDATAAKIKLKVIPRR
jgi:hypothetical protein